ncbi:TonB-dependent receptor [Thalassotalea agarivorans]|uniref:Iron complex outermembrane recepter protein n=1 Tax=Thalassotalea agarivorans TaxID=349064 RepID=A0A1I0FDZ9_THASX|nr:TonB-dependent receptor [Thalassotalea agarivorans]SET55751.1 iron complex outermembrane recepter protein [Thalassotalea agarivorans]
MYNQSKIAKSVRLAMMFGAAALTTSTFAAEEAATEASAEEEVEKIQVTGSRIKRTDMEGALPVTVIDRAQIELSGETSVADLLRNTTFNSAGSFRPQSGSSAQGVSQINLRGIGADRTLVLLDGRRLAKSPSTGGTQDLSTIPMAAVERVEILTDGASAVYGSDAIGGVVNIITRKDYEGVEVKFGQGQIEHEGGDREEGSVVFGTNSDTTSVLAGVSWNKRDIIFQRDFPWYEPGASVFGNSFTDTNAFNWTALPGGCTDNEAFYLIPNSTGIPNSAGVAERCAYNFSLVAADEASTGNLSLFANVNHQINDEWEMFVNSSYSSSSSFGRYAPVPDSNYYTGNALAADSPNNPTNPASAMYDPAFGDNREVYWWHRFDALGNRDSNIDAEVKDIVMGFTGEIVADQYLDFGIRRTKSKTYDIGKNFLVRTTAEAYIADGTYDLQNPSANPDDVLNAMKATISRISEFNQDEIYASYSLPLFEMAGGDAQLVIGAEYRTEEYTDQYDSLSEAGQIGGSAGNSAGGDRTAKAAYFETLFPVMDSLEVSVKGRYDSYSDAGSDFSPQVGVKWAAIEDVLTIRASYGQGFRAPGLDILTQKDSFSADSVNDPATCLAQGQPENCSVQINGTRTANPNLESETSSQYSLGVVYAPLDWFNISVDTYSISIDNRINFFDANELVRREQAGDPIPSGLGVTRDPATGAITNITQGYGNEGTLDTSGMDINAQFYFEDLFGGDLRSNFQMSNTFDYSVDGGRSFVKDPDLPRSRITISNSYTISDFEFAWNINYVHSVAEGYADGTHYGKIPSWTTHDIQATYNAMWDGKITVGMQNVGGNEPPLYEYDGRPYNFNLYNGYGRITYFRYTQSF